MFLRKELDVKITVSGERGAGKSTLISELETALMEFVRARMEYPGNLNVSIIQQSSGVTDREDEVDTYILEPRHEAVRV